MYMEAAITHTRADEWVCRVAAHSSAETINQIPLLLSLALMVASKAKTKNRGVVQFDHAI